MTWNEYKKKRDWFWWCYTGGLQMNEGRLSINTHASGARWQLVTEMKRKFRGLT